MLQRRIALILAVLLLTNLTPNSFAGQDIATEIQAMPPGTNVEVRLKTREREKKTRSRQPTSNAGRKNSRSPPEDQREPAGHHRSRLCIIFHSHRHQRRLSSACL